MSSKSMLNNINILYRSYLLVTFLKVIHYNVNSKLYFITSNYGLKS